MDVTEVAPFTNVECSGCGSQTRVKRDFGPYTLVRRQGIGGMSLVFVAHDNTLQRELALKILNQDQSRSEKRIAQFEEEARITASISHPHVVRVFTTGHSFDRFYIAMELVGGGHLEQKIHEQGAIPEADVLPFAIEIAEGLRAAHARGLIHRDIKPGNILFDAEGHAKIVDFGLALVTKGGTATADEIWATPYYVPPETIDGAAEDFRADIYALGATLYHALAGRPSCAEDSMSSAVLREAKRHIPRITEVAPWLSAETCAVVDRSMAYAPADRFSSYDELIAALNGALNRGDGSPPIHSVARIKRRNEGGRMAVWIAGIAGVAALIGLLVWALGGSAGTDPAPLVVNQPVAVVPAEPNNSSRVSATMVAELYGAAGKAMGKGEFEEAGKLFSALMAKPGVIEPTGSWAGFEAMVAAFLEGDAGKARQRAGALLQHLKALSAPPDVAETFTSTARNVLQVPVIAASKQPSGSSPAALMGLFACGLKNWEQGALDQAADSFQRFADTRLGEDDQWLGSYQGFARKYLADHAKLSAAAPAALPETPEACKKLADGWSSLLGALETKGRARFNVKAWQRAAEQHARVLERAAEGNEVPDAWEEEEELEFSAVVEQVQPLVKTGKFGDALEALKGAKLKAEEAAEQKAWIYVTQAAGDFLQSLEKGCADKVLEVPMNTQDGRKFPGTVGAEPGSVRFVDGGDQIAIPWVQLTAESLTTLHSVLLRAETSEVEKVRRHESAIAYMWLAGDKGKAGIAASRIEDAGFRERWSGAMKVLAKPGDE